MSLNGVHAYMSPPHLPSLMKRCLGGAYHWLTRAYYSTSINAAGQHVRA
jgi:hypothetical protein